MSISSTLFALLGPSSRSRDRTPIQPILCGRLRMRSTDDNVRDLISWSSTSTDRPLRWTRWVVVQTRINHGAREVVLSFLDASHIASSMIWAAESDLAADSTAVVRGLLGKFYQPC